jgi:hypothetical protein
VAGGGAAGAGGSDPGSALSGSISGTRTLCGTLALSGDAVIAAGASITFCDGAVITAGANASLTIAGRVVLAPGTAGVRFGDTGWAGLRLSAGGALEGPNLTISGAAIGLATTGGTATLDNLTINGGTRKPLDVGAGSTVTIRRGTINAMGDGSAFKGKVVLDHVTYVATNADGFTIDDAAADVHVVDSIFRIGASVDFVISNAAAKLVIEHSELTATHCALHINQIGTLDIHDNEIHGNAYGFMLGGGTGPGTRVITKNNFRSNTSAAISQTGDSEVVDLRGNYYTGNVTDILLSPGSTFIDGARLTTPVPGAGPRP